MAKLMKIDRLLKLEEIIKVKGRATVAELSETLNVTEETVRRDLVVIEDKGVIKRVHGGAYYIDTFDVEVPIGIRESSFNKEKNIIANQCLNFINHGDSVAFDSSTTCLAIVRRIIQEKLSCTIITNSLDIAQALEDITFIKLILIGGTFRQVSHSFTGHDAVNFIKNYVIDKSFISCPAATIALGLTDNSQSEATIRETFLKQSSQNHLVIDHTKFGARTVYKIADFDMIDKLITDKPLDEDWIHFCKENNIDYCVEDEDFEKIN